jgi:hypothetical protein
MKRPDHRFSRSIGLWKARTLTQRESIRSHALDPGYPHGGQEHKAVIEVLGRLRRLKQLM